MLLTVTLTIGIRLRIELDEIHWVLLLHPIMHEIGVDDDLVGSKCACGILFPSGLGYTFWGDLLLDVVILPRESFEIY